MGWDGMWLAPNSATILARIPFHVWLSLSILLPCILTLHTPIMHTQTCIIKGSARYVSMSTVLTFGTEDSDETLAMYYKKRAIPRYAPSIQIMLLLFVSRSFRLLTSIVVGNCEVKLG